MWESLSLLPSPALLPFLWREGQGENLTLQSLNLGKSSISLSTYTVKRCLLGYRLLEKIGLGSILKSFIFYLTLFFFPVSDLWLERAGVLGPCVTPWVFVAPEISDKTQPLHSQWGERGVSAEAGRGTEGTQGCLLISHSLGKHP